MKKSICLYTVSFAILFNLTNSAINYVTYNPSVHDDFFQNLSQSYRLGEGVFSSSWNNVNHPNNPNLLVAYLTEYIQEEDIPEMCVWKNLQEGVALDQGEEPIVPKILSVIRSPGGNDEKKPIAVLYERTEYNVFKGTFEDPNFKKIFWRPESVFWLYSRVFRIYSLIVGEGAHMPNLQMDDFQYVMKSGNFNSNEDELMTPNDSAVLDYALRFASISELLPLKDRSTTVLYPVSDPRRVKNFKIMPENMEKTEVFSLVISVLTLEAERYHMFLKRTRIKDLLFLEICTIRMVTKRKAA